MLKIRLARVGKKKKAIYRLVVSEHTKDMYGNHLELLGQYNPHTKEIILKNDRIEHWLKVGAQPSETVENLLVKEGIIKAKDTKAKAVRITKKRQVKLNAKDEEKKAKDAEAPSTDAQDEKKEEVPAKEESTEAPVEEKAPEVEEKKEEAETTEEDPSTDAQNDKK
ncbi:30S ribosomal protein S16 [bacterium]|jgi:small subunit ribosomal protein S16|nr:30S ribosomal protein S16 [bacterium]MBT4649223.1 30S ribosomal protein S16 [bacterium]